MEYCMHIWSTVPPFTFTDTVYLRVVQLSNAAHYYGFSRVVVVVATTVHGHGFSQCAT